MANKFSLFDTILHRYAERTFAIAGAELRLPIMGQKKNLDYCGYVVE